jgi:hypothetical protein
MSTPELLDPADELAIRNLVARLAQMADMAGIEELDDYVGCFTEDGIWEAPIGTSRGREEIRQAATERRKSGGQGPGSNSRHVISTHSVRADGPDQAVSEAYFTAYANTTTAPTILIIGYYYDTMRKTPEGWQIAHRQITFG